MSSVALHDKVFDPYIKADEIDAAIEKLAQRITHDFKQDNPVFLGVLNGSFVFIADLMRKLDFQCEVAFVKLQSYEGTSTTGEVKKLIGVPEGMEGRPVVIVEDIVDTGHTIEKLIDELEAVKPASINIATLLYKPDAYTKQIAVDYVAIEIPDAFVVGYGLDYDGLGRNLKHIYKIQE